METVAAWASIGLGLAFYLYPLFEAAFLPAEVWQYAGYRRNVWLIFLLLIPGVMTILFLLFVRPKLWAARREISNLPYDALKTERSFSSCRTCW